MAVAVTKSGDEWIQRFIVDLDQDECMGCARCYKACPADVFEPYFIEDNEDDDPRTVMSIANDGDCRGCGTCEKVCPKNCITLEEV